MVLNGDQLSYFVHEKDIPDKPKDCIPLLASTITICSQKIDKPYAFQLTYNRRNFFFAADDGKSMSDWLNSIRAAKAKSLGIDEAIGDAVAMQKVDIEKKKLVLSLHIHLLSFQR